ncbi:MAG TPA: TonB-dependent receptor [Bryobacterales bacterium]|nr:TonB-dependent receptor [Bryobacterales bacterium]
MSYKLLGSIVLSLFVVTTLCAQGERTTVTGTVTDASQAIVAGASVSIRNIATNIVTRTTTNTAGIYYLPSLPPGTYELTVEANGFRPGKVENIPLTVGLTATVNVTLEVGQVTQAVEVTATAVQLEAQTSGLGKDVGTRAVAELPLLGRNPLSFAATAPGVIPTRGQQSVANGIIGAATTAQINGGLAQQNGILIDGGESRGTTESGNAYVVPLEAVAEFKLETAAYSAEFGRADGGIVNIATKSGGNQFHGSGWEFLRNNHLNANSWQNDRNGLPKTLFQRNQFGATIGGPIRHDRTFFFATYEGTRQGAPDQVLDTVPTDAQKAGDFSQTYDRLGRPDIVYDPLTTRADPNNPGKFIRDPFPGNKVPGERIHPISQKVLPFWPGANRPGVGPSNVNNFYGAGKSVANSNAWFGRVDHLISDKHRLYGRVGGQQFQSFSAGLLAPAFPSRSISSNPTRSALISFTSSFSPNVLGEFRLSYTRLQFNTHPVSEGFDIGTLGFPTSLTSNVLYKQFPQIGVQTYASGTGLTVTNAPPNEVAQLGGATKNLNPQDTWQAQYHFTFIRTRHKIKTGADLQLIKLNAYNSQYSSGQYIFDRTYTQGPDPNQATLNGGNGMASFLLGVPVAGTLTISPRLFLYQRYYGFYVQDDYRVTDRLTLNLGLRWEYTTPYAEKFGQVGYFDRNATEPVTGMKGVFKFIQPGGYETDPNHKGWAPRVGLAWQVTPKTVVRTAGAVIYATFLGVNAASTDFGNGGFISNFLNLGAPNALPNTPPVGGSWSNPFAGGILLPTRSTDFVGQAIRADQRHHPWAYMGNWTLSIQRMVTSNIMAEVAYSGTSTTHLFWNRQNNEDNPLYLSLGSQLLQNVSNPFYGQIGTGSLSFPTVQLRQLLRPYPQYLDVLLFRDPYGHMNYNSLTARVEKQMSHGLLLSAGYTLSKTIANTAQSNTWVVGPSNALYDPNYNRSIEANDAPQRLVLSYVWDLPFGVGRSHFSHGLAARVLGNWEMSGITVFMSGRPILITGPDQTNLYNFSYTNGRANRLHSGVLSSGQTDSHWIDTTAFAAAPAFTYPTDSLTQPNLRGPGRNNFDMSFIKNMPFREHYNVQFRAEFYNIFNHPALEASGGTFDVSNPQFGQIVSSGNERNVQFGLRMVF